MKAQNSIQMTLHSDLPDSEEQGTHRILIVDDDVVVGESLEKLLRRDGLEVYTALTGTEGIELFHKISPVVVLLDLKMPEMDGFGFLENVEVKNLDSCSVILMTAFGNDEDIQKSFNMGISAFLRKPVNIYELRGLVKNNIDLHVQKKRLCKEVEKHKRKDIELAEKTAYLDNILRSSTDLAIVATDTDFKIIYFNPAAETLFKSSGEEIRGSEIIYLRNFVNMESSAFEMAVKKVNDGDEYGFNITGVSEDGSVRYIDAKIGGIWDNKGELIGYVLMARDITGRKLAEEKIERNFHIQSVISSILRVSLKNISIEEQLENILYLILSIPWLSLESKGSIHLVSGDPDVLVMKASRGLSEKLLDSCAKVPFGKCLCGKAAEKREITFAECLDDRHDIRYDGIMPHGHYCIPIISGKQVLGVINLYVKEGHRRDPMEEEFLSSVANTLAGIIERKKFEDEVAQNYHIQSVISSLLRISLDRTSLDEQIEKSLDLILSIPWLSLQSMGAIYLVEEREDILVLKAWRGLTEPLLELCREIPFGTCLCGLAAVKGRIVFKDKIDEEHTLQYDGILPLGHYCVPIVSDNKVLGIINLYVEAGHKRDQGEEDFLSAVAFTLAGIIERKRVEEAYQESEKKAFVITENSMDAIIMTDVNGSISYCNLAAERMLGYSKNEIIGQEIHSLIAPKKFFQAYKKAFSRAWVSKKEPAALGNILELSALRKDGKEFPVEVSVFAIQIKGQWYATGSIRDITERKKVEKALRKSEERYRNIIRTTSEGFLEIDSKANIVECNDSLIDMFGYAKEDILGKSLYDFAAVEDLSSLKKHFESVMSPDSEIMSLSFNAAMSAGGGRVLFTRFNITALSKKKRQVSGAFALVTDITELIEMKNSLTRYTIELERSNQELQDFANVASHDLQEPLRKVVAFGDRVRDSLSGSASSKTLDYLDRMEKSARRMQQLIEDILMFSRVTTMARPFQKVDLNVTILDVTYDLEERISESGAQISTGELPTIDADRLQMHQLFLNLISNSLKYVKTGEPPQISITSHLTDSRFVEISVKDNGIGFQEKYLDRIFKPFQRLHMRSEYEGTGMGLAICQKIVRRHSGSIMAQSSLGSGATFIVTLPLRETEGSRNKTLI